MDTLWDSISLCVGFDSITKVSHFSCLSLSLSLSLLFTLLLLSLILMLAILLWFEGSCLRQRSLSTLYSLVLFSVFFRTVSTD